MLVPDCKRQWQQEGSTKDHKRQGRRAKLNLPRQQVTEHKQTCQQPVQAVSAGNPGLCVRADGSVKDAPKAPTSNGATKKSCKTDGRQAQVVADGPA